MKFYPLTVKDIRKETSDCVSVAFEVPLDIAQEFQYVQGQYLTMKSDILGDDIRRSYSICSSPYEGELRVAIKLVDDGKFSTFANRVLKKNDVLDVMPPLGHFFTPLHPEQNKSYVFFAAGSGITPIISNIKTILQKEPKSSCTLLYGNQKISTIIFKEEIEAIKNKNLGRFQVFNILSKEYTESDLLNGRLDAKKLHRFFALVPSILASDEYFACGPTEMIEDIQKILIEKNIPEDKIHFELFNAPKNQIKKQIIEKAIESHATIKIDGLTLEVPVEKGQNILDAAQHMGTDMPYACKGGVCCTCRAKLMEGEVEMTANYALTKEEVKNGFILTCQAVPKTKKVVIDFDIK
ncbi:MAG: 2Fe-2S iron-sulfur cluster binding domain-containing protein [Saprospiraceae bacterium]|nr:2Fe-2S iron-sulfur cluster binding domain-containing protein [Saprospiraceae bacterium]MBK7523567.1 2Fe-2S iron-sulfur cluster binding domain-containing protein [Saprospiraceae bacterium]MBK9041714.1 2Fe-2S iron-sulfur cluster binding domain-containing protein [Saprospiraceae bacterium]MBP6694583.1 2Fe-2S iron-sulfur cluster binding domain-containing protein [Saprospiraceae bacterium]